MAKSYIQSGPRLSATSGPGTQPAIAAVTGLTAEAPMPVDVNGVVKAKIILHYKAPANLGTGDQKFTGVVAHVQTPSKVTALPDAFTFSGEAASSVDLEIVLDYPGAEEDWYVYLSSKSDKYTNPLVLRDKDNPTPNVKVTVPVSPLAGEAPDVLVFRAGTFNQTSGEWTPAMRWDPLKTKMLCDWGCMLPSDLMNWSGVAVFIQLPDGTNVQATGVLDSTMATQTNNGLVIYDCIAIEAKDVPNPPQSWTLIACSYDSGGEANHDPTGNPFGPIVTLNTLGEEAKPITDDGKVNIGTFNGKIAAGQIDTVNIGQVVGNLDISRVDNLGSVNISTFAGNLDISRVTNLGTVNITTFQGNLPVSRVDNLGSINITAFQGNLPVTRIDNLGSINISTFQGNLPVSRIDDLGTISISTFQGNLDVGRVANLGSFSIGSFSGVITTQQIQDNFLSDLKKFADNVRPITKVASLPTLPSDSYPLNTVVLNGTDSKLYKNVNGAWQTVTAKDTITGSLSSGDIASVDAGVINGQINAGVITHVQVSQFSGTLSAAQCASLSISSFLGNLDVSRVANINTLNISNLQGNLDASRVANIGTIQISSLGGNLDVSRVNNIGTININSFQGTINNLNATTVNLIGQWQDGQIKAISAGKLIAGSIDVTGTGMTFTGTGGIIIAGGGSINVMVGSVSANSLNAQSAGMGWTIQGGFVGAISGGKTVDVSTGYKINGTLGTTNTISIKSADGYWHAFAFNGGILTSYSITAA